MAMRKTVLTFGFIAGGILSAMMLLSTPFIDRIGFERAEILGYTTMVLAFLMVFFGIKSYRDHVAGGQVTFGRACAVGLLITAVATVCYVITWQFIYYQLAPDFGDKYAAYVVEKARAEGATEVQIAEQEQQMEEFKVMYRNPFINIAFTFIEPLPIGLLFTLVSAGWLSRGRRRQDPAIP
jgi:hypothetical protein